jgi:beta-lactam-binding protein with PASTA domain
MGAESPDVSRATVPNLIGMAVREARSLGQDSGVMVTSADMDGPPLSALTWPGTWIVTGQHPSAGSHVDRWSTVVVEFEELRGAGATDEPDCSST